MHVMKKNQFENLFGSIAFSDELFAKSSNYPNTVLYIT